MSKGFFLAPVAAIMLTLSSFLPAAAQTSACALHDQMCIYHGIGRQMGYDPSGPTSITATANWDQDNDADLHALLPTGPTYSAPTVALPGYDILLSEPFYPDVSGAHIYPNHYESQINGGAATATHSGDAGGGEATYLGQPGCDPAIQSSVTCEAITVQGDVPSGVYSYAIHAFPASGSSFPLTNFSIDVRASGNMVLVSDNPGLQINPETGLIRQTGSFQGSGATTSQLDVYALNVGHAGHVGGVTIPEIASYFDSAGVQRYYPKEPLDLIGQPSVQDQIAGAFLERDQQVAYYATLREQEKQRLARIEAQRQWEREQAALRAQQEKLVYAPCTSPFKSCVSSYVQGEKFVRSGKSVSNNVDISLNSDKIILPPYIGELTFLEARQIYMSGYTGSVVANVGNTTVFDARPILNRYIAIGTNDALVYSNTWIDDNGEMISGRYDFEMQNNTSVVGRFRDSATQLGRIVHGESPDGQTEGIGFNVIPVGKPNVIDYTDIPKIILCQNDLISIFCQH